LIIWGFSKRTAYADRQAAEIPVVEPAAIEEKREPQEVSAE
jgi:hypothetical protein